MYTEKDGTRTEHCSRPMDRIACRGRSMFSVNARGGMAALHASGGENYL